MGGWMRQQGVEWEDDDDDEQQERDIAATQMKKKSATNLDGVTFECDNDESPSGWRKVKLPMLQWNDPLGWIARTEKFFEVHHTGVAKKVQLAFIGMDGPAIHWFWFFKKMMSD